jgi:hypothetical protein
MKIKQILKFCGTALVFSVAYLGFSYSNHTKQVAGERLSVSLFSVGLKAQAYCNEALYVGEVNSGYCNGPANNPTSRCYTNSSPNELPPNCVVGE